MKQMYKDLAESVGLTEKAINFIVENFDPVSFIDFTGYVMDMGVLFPEACKKKCFCLAVSEKGKFQIFPFTQTKKKLTQRIRRKLIKKMYDVNFIAPTIDEPFLEYTNIFNLPIDPHKTHFIEEKLLKERLK